MVTRTNAFTRQTLSQCRDLCRAQMLYYLDLFPLVKHGQYEDIVYPSARAHASHLPSVSLNSGV
jgi:hypothetical protein